MKIGLFALVAGAVAAALARLGRLGGPPAAPADDRADELRRKLAEARAAAADQDDFAAAGMGAETIVEEPSAEPPAPLPAKPEPPPEAPPPTPSAPARKSKAKEPPPQDEFEAMRRRIHEEGKAAAEEMRRSADPEKPEPDQPEQS